MTVTVVRIGTREDCRKSLERIPETGAWDDVRGTVVHGTLVGKPTYDRHEDHWHVQQEMEPA